MINASTGSKVRGDKYRPSQVPIVEVYSTIGLITDQSTILSYLYNIVSHEKETADLIVNSHYEYFSNELLLSNFIIYNFLSRFGITPGSTDDDIKRVVFETIPKIPDTVLAPYAVF